MKTLNKIIYTFLLSLFFISSLHAASKDVELKKGWNQIAVPFDHVKIDLLLASEDVDVIWAYQGKRYHLASNNPSYIKIAEDSFEIGLLNKLSYGESIYIQALHDTTITFVGNIKYDKPVRAEQLTSQWIQMSRSDFPLTEWHVISKIVEGKEVIASKIVMKDGRPTLKVFSNVADEVSKIDAEFFEDFEVGENESFWIKDVTNISNISKFDFSVSSTTPLATRKGGSPISFDFDIETTSTNKNYLAVKIVALKDGNPDNKEYILFDDYIQLKHGVQTVDAVLPMFLSENFGSYKIYAIKDLPAQYDKFGIDYFDMQNVDVELAKTKYKTILANSDYINVNLSENSTAVEYRLKMASREYANNVLYYDPVKELNSMALNAKKEISNFDYQKIGKHTEFQVHLETFGNGGQPVKETKVKGYIKVNGSYEEIIVLSERAGNEATYSLDNMKISFPDEKQGQDLTLSMMLYGTEALADNWDNTQETALYTKIMAELTKTTTTEADRDTGNTKTVYPNRICLDTACTQWIFKKDFEIGIAIKENANPTSADIKDTTTVTLYSETFSKSKVKNYTSKDTVLSITNNLLKEDTYNNPTDLRKIGKIGTVDGSDILITDLTTLKSDLINSSKTTDQIFDPLVTYENDVIDKLIYAKDATTGEINKLKTNNAPLKTAWKNYLSAVGDDTKLCNRRNYLNLTAPYIKKVANPNGGDDIDILTSTQDLCLYNVKYDYLNGLTPEKVEVIAHRFKDFIAIKNTQNEATLLADYWNPLFKLDNAALHIPEFIGTTIPLLKKRMGGGITFSSKLALDSELNELRTNAYVDVDVALIKEFKILDLDFETVVSGSDSDASRFDFYLYSINPTDGDEAFGLKKVFGFHQKIQTTYEVSKMIDVTFNKGKDIDIPLFAGVNLHIGFEMGLYASFQVGANLDLTDHLMIYAVPGARIFGTLEGGLNFGISKLSVTIGIRLNDFTVIRVAVPLVAVLNNLRLDKEGFSSQFKVYGNLVMRMAEINVGAFVAIKLIGLDLYINLYSYHGFDPLDLIPGVKVGKGKVSDVTDCQKGYIGLELFCIKKDLKIEFEFSGLTQSECKLLDDDYLRRKEYDKDTSYLYSTNEYRKVRGCINDNYKFKNVKIANWKLSDAQVKELSNTDFWKWDSRGTIAVLLEKGAYSNPYATPWQDAWKKSSDSSGDEIQKTWKKMTNYKW